jgi:hypothetical protein
MLSANLQLLQKYSVLIQKFQIHQSNNAHCSVYMAWQFKFQTIFCKNPGLFLRQLKLYYVMYII